MKYPKVAVIGLGFMGRTHIHSLRRLGIEVYGVAGISEDEAKSAASELSIPKWYRNSDEAIEDPEVQAVHLCTPNNLHFSQAKKALISGKHVLCEKPLAMTMIESRELADLAKEKDLVTAVNYNLRFYPICQEARARIAAGELGIPYLIHGAYLQDWLFLKSDWNWRLEPQQGGNLRVVADIGTHWMDMVTYLTGLKITEVMADFSTIHPIRLQPTFEIATYAGKLEKNLSTNEVSIKTEDVAVILFRFENGALGNVSLSQVSAGRKNFFWFEISGSKSAIRWDQENPNELWIGYRDQPNQLLSKDPSLFYPEARALTGFPGGHAEGYPDTFVQVFSQFYGAIASGKMPETGKFATFEDGHHEMQLCDAIRRSALEKRWVKVSEIEKQ
ncbi:MAG: oxidoreductase domain-containing protein [Chloroflexi bacterium]|nr:MAG: oxidoreductase domain-containing protein [Chloroflexota bacterium]MBA4376253.1 dehydrogenase [Anaerolinea sp.]